MDQSILRLRVKMHTVGVLNVCITILNFEIKVMHSHTQEENN